MSENKFRLAWNEYRQHNADVNQRDFYSGIESCAKIKDAEIELIESALTACQLDYADQMYEITQLKAQVEKMRELRFELASVIVDIENDVFDKVCINTINRVWQELNNLTPQSSLSDHDRKVEINLLDRIIKIESEFGWCGVLNLNDGLRDK
jgi:hypothetical protein